MSKNNLTSFLAIDLGASSGRAILGKIDNGILELKEINRFPNPITNINGRMYWDLFYLYNKVLQSLIEIKADQIPIKSIGIDTWGVDFVCFGKDGEPLRMPYSYRDPITFGAPEKFFNIISKEDVYKMTGIQIMNFNSLYQLFAQKDRNCSTYSKIDKILFMPDALSYLLTGKMVTEYTIASTSQLINPYNRSFESTLLDSIGLSKDNFAPIVFSGTSIGQLSNNVKQQTGQEDVSVIAVAGHDTASAVLATPAENDNFAYLSSGTWSLMGIESLEPVINEKTYSFNFTNEAGTDGSIRLLKNICGMWLIEQCKKDWEKHQSLSYNDIVIESEKAVPFKCFINPDSPCFANPKSMIESIQNYCKLTGQYIPQTIGEIARCIYESLAFRYKQVLESLQQLSTKRIETLHIIGGGSQNRLLNSYTANAIGLPVVAGPSEATAIGNILLQAKACGLVNDKSEMRRIVRNSVKLETFIPKDVETWEKQYLNYLDVYKEL
ncbi:MAG: rhamnulokinase family protein [Dysgonamonadaceae bacterium]|jgi:rhamnulokinase|nr:rhamnulokinase family protein [Dysgonamonadaceae bacterium]